MAKKIKYSRRRAIECKLERKSISNPGYYKYNVTIREKDGTVHTEPAYGKDMQDAISRLINIERTKIIEKKMERNPFLFFLVWMAIMSIPVLLYGDMTYSPWFVLYMFGSFTALFAITGWWQHYLEKGK
tara:strand:+ start:257 stop:643 length:387 start_codon:yes stop_codon:yes gene_type:complete